MTSDHHLASTLNSYHSPTAPDRAPALLHPSCGPTVALDPPFCSPPLPAAPSLPAARDAFRGDTQTSSAGRRQLPPTRAAGHHHGGQQQQVPGSLVLLLPRLPSLAQRGSASPLREPRHAPPSRAPERARRWSASPAKARYRLQTCVLKDTLEFDEVLAYGQGLRVLRIREPAIENIYRLLAHPSLSGKFALFPARKLYILVCC